MNKFMKKIMSKKDGFTLVELIVVIAILAILAGVAVPAYSAYIKNANEGADIAALDAYKTAAQAALITKGEVTKLEITASSVTAYVDGATTGGIELSSTLDVVTYDDEFKAYVGIGTGETFSYTFKQSGITKATWNPSETETWSFSAS